jgi:hypothetical protein
MLIFSYLNNIVIDWQLSFETLIIIKTSVLILILCIFDLKGVVHV